MSAPPTLDHRGRGHLSRWPIYLMLFSLPLIIHGLSSVQSDTTDMNQWLPEGKAQRQAYDRFVSQFGPDDFVMVSWSDCRLGDPKLAQFASSLRARITDAQPLIHRVITGEESLAQLTADPPGLSRSGAMQRLRGTVLGDQLTCAVVEVTKAGNADPHGVVQLIMAAVDDVGLSEDEVRLGGGIYEAVHIDLVSVQSFRRFVGWSALVAILAAWVSTRSVRLTIIVFIVGGYCGALSVALIHYCGMRFNALMLVLPTLIYVLMISSAVHLVNYYVDAVHQGHRDPAGAALTVGWLPCALALVTTAIGMMSLAASQIQHVRSFGIFAALSLLISMLVLLAFVPVALRIVDRGDTERIDHSRKRKSEQLVNAACSVVIRFHLLIAIALSVLLLLVGVGLTKTTSSVKIEKMFRSDDRLIENYRWFEKNIGPLAAIEVLVRTPQESPSLVNQIELLRELGGRIEQVEHVGAVFSAASLTPRAPTSGGIGATARRAVLNKQLTKAKAELVADRVLAEQAESHLWRLTARIPALEDLDFDAVVQSIDQQVQSVLVSEKAPDRFDIAYTGSILVMHQARVQLLQDLVKTFAAAFVLICPLMMLILRSFVAGLLSMIPNLVPAVVIFGGMGWLGVPIEIGTILTGCVALGIAVDDTLHFLTWYRRSSDAGNDPWRAINEAYQRCAMAMIQTTMICGLGLLVFAASDFVPTSRFAVLMFALLIAALVGDLLLLPAILAGPAGRFFRRRQLATVDSGVSK